MATTQTRTARAQSTAWPPPSTGHTRPWRSSPLAGPAFSTLPPVIPESSEESHENGFGQSGFPRTRSPSSSSIVSQTGSLSASGYGSRNTSSSASALALADGEASTSSVSLGASTGAHGTSSASSQSHTSRPARLSKSFGRRPSSAQGAPKSASDVFVTHPQRARTVSHGSRPVSFPVHPLAPSPTIPQAYSRTSPRPTSPDSDANTAKQPTSKSRDPSSNWMSSSPFGPAQTPKFSRLAMASPRVVMPLSAKEYRKQKAKDKGRDKDPPTSSHRVAFVENALHSPNGVPLVKVSPPTAEDVHRTPSSSGDHSPDRRSQPQPQLDHPPPQPTMSPRPSSPKLKRPRSRPNTPPRSSPLAAHPPLSPKSSAGTFFSFASVSDDGADDPNALPPARPRPRRHRRKSYPDSLSNGARPSLLEAMNRLSQESTSLHRHSGVSQFEGANRLSVASQASGHTLFYDVGESEGEQGQVTTRNGNGNENDRGPRTSILHTQSLENLSSTLTRTGIEVIGQGRPGEPVDEERKGKRNVRVVRISDKVEVSPPPVHRRRKLTKSRPGPARASVPASGAGSAPGTGLATIKEVNVQTQTQPQERRGSLLPWKSKGSGDGKASVGTGASTQTNGLVLPDESTAPPLLPFPIANGSTHIESPSKYKSNGMSLKKPSSDTPAPGPMPEPESAPSTPPRKSRRYTFSLLPSSTFHRPKREKTHTAPPSVDLSLGQHSNRKPKTIESGTDSTSTSIRTITQGSQSTLVPASPVLYDLTTPASSGILSSSGRDRNRDARSSVPMLRRLTAQEMAMASVPSQADLGGKSDSTPSLITNASTATSSSSAPRTPSFGRVSGGGGESFIPRPSALKESFTDTSEDDSDGAPGGTSRPCMHRRPDKSPLARGDGGWGETSLSEDERHLRPNAGARPTSRASSTLTTATETSVSYASFSTVPASSASSVSTSRSQSPSPTPPGDKQDRLQEQGGEWDGDACALCGHRSTSPSPLSTHELDTGGMHPMFVPLVTIPGMSPRSASSGGSGGVPRYARKNERHPSVLVPGGVCAPSSRYDLNANHMPVNANTNGGPITSTPTRARTMPMPMQDRMTRMTTTPSPSPSPLPPPPKAKLRRRPQTAPAGPGDAALKFIEDAKAMRVREGSIDAHTHLHLAGVDRATTTKHKRGESKFKAVMRGLLRWGG